jgi:diguanylate cyclase (GGDEF)-like protein
MFIDLDNFKAINDTYGHDAGDKILINMIDRIKMSIRKSDIIGRYAGDEFLVAVRHIKDYSIVEKVAKDMLTNITLPIFIDTNEIISTISIGISIFPDHSKNIDELIKQADKAMYEIKQKDKNNYKIYIPN